jgi:nitroimidazol reductase NimA-like FMN-containing flavoprotein (pyridoxamine 5'-phosphate oxidase superfamily)
MPAMTTAGSTQSERTTLKRKPERGSYDRTVIDSILDEGLVAHVGFVADGQPFVIPMAYGRDDDHLVLHGSVAGRTPRALGSGAPVCVTVTLLDGLVVSRSQFHTSMNYRAVVVLGVPRRIDDLARKRRALACVVDHVVPGLAAAARPPTDEELRQTLVVELPIDEASAKVRTGGPAEEPDDLLLDVWGGVLPLHVGLGAPIPDGQGTHGVAIPEHVTDFRRPGAP